MHIQSHTSACLLPYSYVIVVLYCSPQTQMPTPCSAHCSAHSSKNCYALCFTIFHACWTWLAGHMVVHMRIFCTMLSSQLLEFAISLTAHIQSLLKAQESMTSAVRHVPRNTRLYKGKVCECACMC